MSNSESPPPASADLQTTWAFLEEGIDLVMANTPISYAKHVALTTAVFNYCISSKRTAKSPASAAFDGTAAGRRPAHGANLMGGELYKNVNQYFGTHLGGLRNQIQSLEGEALLQYYAAEWSRYTKATSTVNHIFTHLNRHWTQRERDEGRRNVYPVDIVALVKWKDTVFIPFQTNLVGAVLRLIDEERNGRATDQDLVKITIDSFVALGVDDLNTNKQCLDIYKEHFEPPFIDATEKYYKSEAEIFLESHSMSDYLQKAEDRLREEEDRVKRYLNARTREPLIGICEQILVRERSSLIWDSFLGALESGRDEDLQRIYSLLSRIPDGLEPLQQKFEEHVVKSGLAATSKLVEAGSTAESLDLKLYVDALLAIWQKNSETITKNFADDAGFVASLDKGCREFANRNAATGQSSSMSRELIVKYADLLLHEANKLAGTGDSEPDLNRVMILFQYLEDGDSLTTLYTTALSQPTIQGVSSRVESEPI
ncbi:hypothetical protein M413DRAFT_445858 [Hebeloma cylindrosporum]|uniref:Cullin family profile domain-containing protein n=1 Tax=Hebeloma cylindrosporum TaxID=76867 RepID=A0A0C3CAB2_HEBCY|nr:hypothetical protein M413DRAFT_445858 [Hebeloma cylindrosporum h7]